MRAENATQQGPPETQAAASGDSRRDEAQQKPQADHRRDEPLGGWLILPALGLLLGPLVVSGNIRMSLDALRRPALPADAREFVTFVAGLLALFLLLQLYTAYQFFRRRVCATTAIVALLIANLLLTMLMSSEASQINPAYQAAPDVMGAAIMAAIWIPYFVMSRRVKRTFVR